MRASVAIALCLISTAAGGQDTTASPLDSVRPAMLPAVEIAVTRDPRAATLMVPYAISITRRNALDARGQMQDILSGMLGVFVANRNNPTQDPRIVIRGRRTYAASGPEATKDLRLSEDRG